MALATVWPQWVWDLCVFVWGSMKLFPPLAQGVVVWRAAGHQTIAHMQIINSSGFSLVWIAKGEKLCQFLRIFQ